MPARRTHTGPTRAVHVPGRATVPRLSWADFGLQPGELDWQTHAACAAPDIDPDLFFPEPRQAAQAQRICAACPVRQQCQAHAQRHRERHGIWGGLSTRKLPRTRQPGHAATRQRAVAVARLTRAGLTSVQIAQRLDLSPRTIDRYRAHHQRLEEAA
ncbi:WhiB family transcriptional regulator [Prauserella muralis]|uniref:WhiB family transcriptional regulator n=1 Tax=Prauserella muralis TaxID=588067 RepID=UPI000DD4780B|nr:WhiB family transcriptional regulator [Prauserella muralis]TWE14598.1 WhiB family redox-sensing transcriptional regulator [Prauserella muralis]